MTLDQVRLKVFAGEALTDAELARLQVAVQNHEDRDVRALWVQALVNADALPEALTLADRLLRDAPRDAQLLLAKARALISAERWADAEPVLTQALAVNPDDPEIFKALAVIHLRRHELARAHDWVKKALERDPFDAEAQTLMAELAPQVEGSAPELASSAAERDFREKTLEALKRKSIAHLVQGDSLLIRAGTGAAARLSWPALRSQQRASGQSVDTFAEALATELAQRTLGLKPGRLPLLLKVLPVVRDARFLEQAEGAVHREGPADTFIFYVIEDPAFVRYVPERSLQSARVTLDELDEHAFKNLAHKPVLPKPIELVQGALRLAAEPTGLWGLTGNDGHDAARLFSRPTQAALEETLGAEPLRCYLGLRELVLLCRASDEALATQLSQMQATDEGIAGAFEYHRGTLKRLSAWSGV